MSLVSLLDFLNPCNIRIDHKRIVRIIYYKARGGASRLFYVLF